jgi:phospholipase C
MNMNHSTKPRSLERALSRRRFLQTAAVAAAGSSIGVPSLLAKPKAKSKGGLGNMAAIQNIIVVMMENRSYDHFLGWLPGSDGRQSGLIYTDAAGASFPTYPLAPDYQGCGHPDPDHSYEGARIEFNGGACDGWLRAGENDRYSIGYYTDQDLAFFRGAAPAWTTCDRYFSGIMASTFPNRIYQHAAQTDRLENSFTLCTLPTIWDRLQAAQVSAKYYYSDFPFLALWGTKYLPISHFIDEFFADCAAGTLPHVSYVEPRFIGEELGITNDDHPYADVRDGQAFLNEIYTAVTRSPNWANTVLVINYDEWGGFFDHVAPPTRPVPAADLAAGDSEGRVGFRTPCLVISPRARRAHVAHDAYDHTSVLKMIETRFRLAPLTVRDATANNLLDVLDLGQPNMSAPAFDVPPGPFGLSCPLAGGIETSEWFPLVLMALESGFPLGFEL